jgi:soluble cytochrome b562
LIKKRKALIAEGKIEEAKVVAKQLCDINPEYFSFMDPNINF